MYVYAHRGNVQGPNARENEPDYVLECLRLGFRVEIDVWHLDGHHWLGHDGPTHPVDLQEFDRLEVIMHLKSPVLPPLKRADAFAIDQDPYAVTLRGLIWANYGTEPSPRSIMCAPELVGAEEPLEEFVRRVRGAYGICTDYPLAVRRLLGEMDRESK